VWAVGQRQTKGKFYIVSTHCTAIETGQASEPMGKRACLLNLNQISELIMDSGSHESVWCGCYGGYGVLCRSCTGTSAIAEQIYKACSSAQAPLGLHSASISEEECSEWVRSTSTTATKSALDTNYPFTFRRV